MDTKTLSTSRYNSTNSQLFSVEYLVVAGGGGSSFGGGGAGGLLTAAGFAVTLGTPITVTVGAGGSGQTSTIFVSVAYIFSASRSQPDTWHEKKASNAKS